MATALTERSPACLDIDDKAQAIRTLHQYNAAAKHANDGFDPSAGIDADLSADGAAARVLVVPAREDVEIARGTRSALG